MPVLSIDVTVTSDDGVVPLVRRVARQAGAVLGAAVDAELVGLLTTEVVANAVRESAGEVVIRFSRRGWDRLRVGVQDRAPGRPLLRRPAPLAEGGSRGLLIVEELADAWGVDDAADGKIVWFELAAAPAASYASSGSGRGRT